VVTLLGHGGVARQNTIEAFLEARRQGADGVELDVRRSGDDAMVVFHDAHLADGRLIADLGVDDLPPEVPLLGAALDACDGMVVNIEIKNFPIEPDYDPDEFLAGAVAALVGERKLHRRVVVSSFSLDVIDRVREVDPEIPTGYLTSATWDQLACLERMLANGHRVFHPNHVAVGPDLVEAVHSAGVRLNTWTVDDPDRIRWLADIGVDGIITNTPDVALAVLRG
jgi:glycerophosphoryl diester phosphodiesterase